MFLDTLMFLLFASLYLAWIKMIRPNTNRHLMNMSNFCHKIGMRRVQRCVLTRNTCKIISIKGLPAPQIMVSSIAFTCIVNINGLNFSWIQHMKIKQKRKFIIWIGGTLFAQFLFFSKNLLFLLQLGSLP